MNGRAIAVIAVFAAFLFALAAFYQQRAARVTDQGGNTAVGGSYALMSRLIRNRVWLTGWAINLAGFGVQAIALHLGSVAAVQPMLITQLMFAMLLASWEQRSWPLAQDWAAVLAICTGLILLLLVVNVRPLEGEADRGWVLLATAVAAALIVVLVPLSVRMTPNTTVVVTGACAGMCFAMTAVFIKLTADDLVNHGVAYTATDWVGYALAGSTLVGLVLEQRAFANGPLPWAVATKESVNPVASFAIGVLAFSVSFPTSAGALAVLACSAVLLVAGAFGLAASPSSDRWLRRDAEDAGTGEAFPEVP